MAYKFLFLPYAEKQLRGLDPYIARRIVKKLVWISRQSDPIRHAKALHNPKIGDIRFRIGDFRIVAIVDRKRGIIAIAAVGHRRDIYR